MKLEPFDIILIIKKGFIGEIIGSVTDSIYSHVALVIDDNHIIDVAFATPVKIRHINYRLGEFDAFRMIVPLKDTEKMKITKFYQKAINAKYDFGEFLSVGIKSMQSLNKSRKYICSSLVNDAFLSAGIRLVEKDGIVTPADVSNSPLLRKVNQTEFSGVSRMEQWRPF